MSEHQRAASLSRLNWEAVCFFSKCWWNLYLHWNSSHVVDGCVSAQVPFSLLCSSFDLRAGKQKGIKEQLHNCKLNMSDLVTSSCVHRFARKTFNFFSPPPPLQALIFSPTAQTSVRLWATPIAAGCRASCPLTGARVPTTGATSMCPAWTRSPTQRYLKAQSKRPIDHSPPLAKRRLSVTNTSTSTSATSTAP